MALTKCAECGHQISSEAVTCPSCGAKVKRTTLFTKIVGGFFAIWVLLTVIGQFTAETERVAQTNEEAAAQLAEQARLAAMTPEQREEAERQRKQQELALVVAEQRRLGLMWNYHEIQDQMGRGQIRQALVSSLNQVDFSFPYHGRQRAQLQLRTHPRHGRDVILSVERGQFLCGVNGCTVKVRFGTGNPVTYRALAPADHSTNHLFISNYAQFLANTRRVDRVSIEATFFQEGSRMFEFDVSGLEWP